MIPNEYSPLNSIENCNWSGLQVSEGEMHHGNGNMKLTNLLGHQWPLIVHQPLPDDFLRTMQCSIKAIHHMEVPSTRGVIICYPPTIIFRFKYDQLECWSNIHKDSLQFGHRRRLNGFAAPIRWCTLGCLETDSVLKK